MDFFTHQETARKKTGTLLLYMFLAILGITASIYIVIWFMLSQFTQGSDGQTIPHRVLINPEILLGVGIGTLLLVGCGALYKMATLRSGGSTVAKSLGGILISTTTDDADERKILNIVEEMAIASGLPTPPIYLLPDEYTINAFAAGYRPETAVVGITRGAIRALDRNQLQGVVAHEFSHILNGDMRLNIRLIGVLHGILLIALLGYQMIRISAHSRSSSSDSAKGKVPVILLGVSFIIIGQIGVFFGHLIKSAVSRQREFLADASAVQFTRYPEGLCGALKKIGGLKKGSVINHPRAEEASHMYFSHGLKRKAIGALATHPPLGKRVRRLDPNFTGDFKKISPADLFSPTDPDQKTPSKADETEFAQGLPPLLKDLPIPAAAQPVIFGGVLGLGDSTSVVNSVGNPTSEHMAEARKLLGAIPEELKTQATRPTGARALIFAQLLRHSAEQRADMLVFLKKHLPSKIHHLVQELEPHLSTLPPGLFLPLAELCVGGLRDLDRTDYHQFKRRVQVLVELDRSITLFEFALGNILFRSLDVHFDGEDRKPFAYYALTAIAPQASTLLSAMSRLGQQDEDQARAAFSAAQKSGPKGSNQLVWLKADQCTLRDIQSSLDDMNVLAYPVRRHLLTLCLTCLTHDKSITIQEAELFRAIAASLGCPVPVWVVGE